MNRIALLAPAALMAAALMATPFMASGAFADPSPDHPGEQTVDPYTPSNANAGATPRTDPALFAAFHGKDGVSRIVDDLVARAVADPRISEIFKNQDLVRLRRTLKEQLCYLMDGGESYSGRDMKASHKDMGIQDADFNALVENLQKAMNKEGVPFRDQNRLLALLAPMHKDVVTK